MKNIFVIVILALLINGCVSVAAIPIGSANYPPHTKNVLVYSSLDDVEKEYEKIAIITAKTGDGDFVGDKTFFDKMKKKAQTIGADAIVFEEQSDSRGYGLISNKSFRVTAIRFK